jgi:hypothetical protein
MLDEPPWQGGATGSLEICPSCGIQFGYDDMAGGDFAKREEVWRSWRNEWMQAGMRWWSQREPPDGLNPRDQLRNIM